MKAVLALVLIYIGTFLVAIQGASQNPVKAAAQNAGTQDQATTTKAAPIDPAKKADILSLMELLGVHDSVQDAVVKGSEQFRENLLASVPSNDRGQAFVNDFVDKYQKKFNADDMTDEVASVYDKHFTADEIKGLLQFYGSPLGQKYASEMPKVTAESTAAGRAHSMRIAREILQDLRKEYPGVGAQARLNKQKDGQAHGAKQQNGSNPAVASASQP
jgi:uncharacterized protein